MRQRIVVAVTSTRLWLIHAYFSCRGRAVSMATRMEINKSGRNQTACRIDDAPILVSAT